MVIYFGCSKLIYILPLLNNTKPFAMEQQDLLQPLEEEIYLERISPGLRFVNYLIDIIAFYLLYFAIFFIIGIFISKGSVQYDEELSTGNSFVLSDAFIYAVAFITFIGYYSLMEGFAKGRTLGKLITGSRVVMNDGTKVTIATAFVRSLCRIVPFEPFSALTGYPWHDRWTNTQVVKVRKN